MSSKKISRSKLVKKADKVFSEYIRRRYADARGYAKCFTCGKVDHWKKLQCGHFQSRKNYSTRWEEMNCQVQCSGCNIFKSGEQYRFGRNLDISFGQGTADILFHKAKKTVKYTNVDLLELIEHYKNKLAQLK